MLSNKGKVTFLYDVLVLSNTNKDDLPRGNLVLFPTAAAEPQGAFRSPSAFHSLSFGHMKAAGPIPSLKVCANAGAAAKNPRVRMEVSVGAMVVKKLIVNKRPLI